MRLYLLRHGIAENGRAGFPDSERALTAEGRRKLKDVLGVARTAGVAPDAILTSPYKRALQTSEVAAQVLGYQAELIKSDVLVPGSAPADVWTELRAFRDQNQVLLVSHEPLIGNLLGYLLGAPSLNFDFKKGALARVDFDMFGPHPRGVLRWFLAPKLAGE